VRDDAPVNQVTPVPTHPVDVTGDATVLFTAPFYLESDALTAGYPLPARPETQALTSTGCLIEAPSSFDCLFRGTLTYDVPETRDLLQFTAGPALRQEILGLVDAADGHDRGRAFDTVEVHGILFPDGYGSVAVILTSPGGWDADRRPGTLAAVGREGREALAGGLRETLLRALNDLVRTLGHDDAPAVTLPYFNLTYVGESDRPDPGRAALAATLRPLVYPNSPDPLTSVSPWRDQFFYAGYAYNVMIMADPDGQVEKLAHLLLLLDVLYARLARTAEAADAALAEHRTDADTAWLNHLANRLRSEYQALVTPTFSFDHHALRLRDEILASWDTDRLQARTHDLLEIVRENVTLRLAAEQARRLRRVNTVVTVLTGLSLVATLEAAVSLVDLLGG
jgi:hypothetical protein